MDGEHSLCPALSLDEVKLLVEAVRDYENDCRGRGQLDRGEQLGELLDKLEQYIDDFRY